MQDLSCADTLRFRLIRFNVGDGTGLPAPGMVDEQLRIDAEKLVKQFLVVIIRGLANGTTGNVAHGVESLRLQLFGVAFPYPPEIRKGTVGPEVMAVALLRQLCDAGTVLVRRDALSPDVHGNFAEVEIRPDARRGGNSRSLQHIQNDFHGEVPGAEAVSPQIVGYVHENLVNGIIDDILRGNILQVNIVNPGAPVHVMGHPGRSHDIVHGQTRVRFQLNIAGGGAGELPPGSLAKARGVDLLDPLNHLEQPRPAGDAPGF